MRIRRKEDLIANVFSISIGFILLGIVFTIAWLSIRESTRPQAEPTVINPTPYVPAGKPTEEDTATTDARETIADTLEVDSESLKTLLYKLENREPLSVDDAFAKAKILSLLPRTERSGIVHQSNTIIVEYIQPADEFKVQILTPDISLAKAQANVWFRTKGMSQQGVCDLPLNFFLTTEVSEILRERNVTFNVLPNGCE